MEFFTSKKTKEQKEKCMKEALRSQNSEIKKVRILRLKSQTSEISFYLYQMAEY